ncbi:MAG: flavin reductase family protein [Bacteroidota bacterium]|nr:flavin reductase family protein [Bacteroidota bacterium]
MHVITAPHILYFGTPVVLIGTTNEDGSYNLAPMSSIFWLGWRCMIGMASSSKTTQNLLHTGECVLNLASRENAAAVNRLARTTGSNPVPPGKIQKGYFFESHKFERAGLSPAKADLVNAPIAMECPVHLEAKLVHARSMADEDASMRGRITILELKIVRVHADEALLVDGYDDKIDPDKWKPLVMSFQKFYSLGEQVHYSTLAEIPEARYLTPDRERA